MKKALIAQRLVLDGLKNDLETAGVSGAALVLFKDGEDGMVTIFFASTGVGTENSVIAAELEAKVADLVNNDLDGFIEEEAKNEEDPSLN